MKRHALVRLRWALAVVACLAATPCLAFFLQPLSDTAFLPGIAFDGTFDEDPGNGAFVPFNGIINTWGTTPRFIGIAHGRVNNSSSWFFPHLYFNAANSPFGPFLEGSETIRHDLYFVTRNGCATWIVTGVFTAG